MEEKNIPRRKFYINDVVKNEKTGTEMIINGYTTLKDKTAYKGKVIATGKTITVAESSLVLVRRGEKP